jgi:dimethylglycine dehydrogenase
VIAGTVPKAGRTSLGHALTPKGKVYAELTLTGLPDNKGFMIVTGSGSERHDLRHLVQVLKTNISI